MTLRKGNRRIAWLGLLIVVLLFALLPVGAGADGETQETAIEVPLNGVYVSGGLSDIATEVYCKVELPESGYLEIDTRVYMYVDSVTVNGPRSMYLRYSYGNQDSWRFADYVEAGTYYFRFSRYYDLDGTFEISANFTPGDCADSEADDEADGANTVELNGDYQRGMMSRQDARDYWKIVLPESGYLTVETRANLRAMGTEICDENLWYVYEGADNLHYGGELDSPKSNVLAAYLEAGTYYLRFSKNLGYTGEYEFKTSFIADNHADDNAGGANLLELNGDYQRGAISAEDIIDYWKIVLPQPGRLTLDVQATMLYLGTEVYDADLTTVYMGSANSYYGGRLQSPQKCLFSDFFEAGTYYVKFTQTDDYTGLYNVKASFEATNNIDSDSDNTKESANVLLPNGEAHRGLRSVQDKEDWWRLDLPYNGYLSIECSVSQGFAYTYMYATFEEGRREGYSILHSFGSEEVFTLSDYFSAGTYYVYIHGGYTGVYEIRADYTAYSDTDREPNDSAEEAVELPLSEEYSHGILVYPWDVDYYRLEMPNSREVRFDIRQGVPNIMVTLKGFLGDVYGDVIKENFAAESASASNMVTQSFSCWLEEGECYLIIEKPDFSDQNGNGLYDVRAYMASTLDIAKPTIAYTYAGEPITVTATASGGTENYVYTYTLYNRNEKVIEEIADINAASAIFNDIPEGTYYVRVKVTDGEDTVISTRSDEFALGTRENAPLKVANLVFTLSDDGKSIFIEKPVITGGVEPYKIAYNIYDAQGNAVNYFYSDDAVVAATPGKNGRFNVFVTVTDAAGQGAALDTGWQKLDGYTSVEASPTPSPEPTPSPTPKPSGKLTMSDLTFSVSEDRTAIFLDRPTITGGTGKYTIAYNIYDDQGNAVNYFYSDEEKVAASPNANGTYNVFVVVSDGKTTIQTDTGWQVLDGYTTSKPSGKLAMSDVTYTVSEDSRSIFIDKPTITGGTGKYTIAYNIYDSEGNAVNYFYSDAARVAASPNANGMYNVFVVVSDGKTTIQKDIGWQVLTGYTAKQADAEPEEEPVAEAPAEPMDEPTAEPTDEPAAEPTAEPVPAPQKVRAYMRVTENRTPLLAKADESADVIALLADGEVVYAEELLAGKDGALWAFVQYVDEEGYVDADCLREMSEAETQAYLAALEAGQAASEPAEAPTEMPDEEPAAEPSEEPEEEPDESEAETEVVDEPESEPEDAPAEEPADESEPEPEPEPEPEAEAVQEEEQA